MPSLLAIFGLDANPLKHGLDQAVNMSAAAGEKIGKSLGEGITEYLGELATAAFLEETIRRTVEYATKIEDLSHRLGISTDAVQIWDFALKQNGSTVDAAAGFFEKLAVTRMQALEGNNKLVESFQRLGVSLDDLRDGRVENIAEMISEAFKSGDPQALIESLREVGGRGAGQMVATLRDGIKESKAEAEKLGIVIKGDVLASLKASGDQWVQFKSQMMSVLAPVIARLVNGAQEILYAYKGVFAGIAAGWQAIWDHPTHVADAASAFRTALLKVRDEEDEGARALLRKQTRDAKALPPEVPEEKEAADKTSRDHTERRRQNDLNANEKIGAFAGASSASPETQIAQRSEEHLAKTEQHLSKIEDHLDKIRGTGRDSMRGSPRIYVDDPGAAPDRNY